MAIIRQLKIVWGMSLLALLLSVSASAFDQKSFSKELFDELQQAGALILVDIHADWCPTCARQQDILAAYQEERPEVSLHILRVDFDSQKEWVRHFRAPRQSTLLLYRGEEQLWFSVAETNREAIFQQLDQAAGAR